MASFILGNHLVIMVSPARQVLCWVLVLLYFCFCFLFFETGFLPVALEPVLELAVVDQVGLELTEICPPLSPEGTRHHRLVCASF